MTATPAAPALPRLSGVVVCRDEADMIDGCLRRLVGVCDEVVVAVDDRTEDDTEARARALVPTVHRLRFRDFAQAKNDAIARCRGAWVLVVDADERVSRGLGDEVRRVLDGDHDAHRVRIENYFFGRRIRHGGWRERPIRLFRREHARYEGEIHERLVLREGSRVGQLEHGLAHFSHRSIRQNLHKTMVYADIQAREMLAAGHPPVRARTFARVIARETWRHTLAGRGFLDGMPGVLECIYQPFSLFTVYARLWELQQRPSLEERYAALEEALP